MRPPQTLAMVPVGSTEARSPHISSPALLAAIGMLACGGDSQPSTPPMPLEYSLAGKPCKLGVAVRCSAARPAGPGMTVIHSRGSRSRFPTAINSWPPRVLTRQGDSPSISLESQHSVLSIGADRKGTRCTSVDRAGSAPHLHSFAAARPFRPGTVYGSGRSATHRVARRRHLVLRTLERVNLRRQVRLDSNCAA